jgi:hypothetical protein
VQNPGKTNPTGIFDCNHLNREQLALLYRFQEVNKAHKQWLLDNLTELEGREVSFDKPGEGIPWQLHTEELKI